MLHENRVYIQSIRGMLLLPKTNPGLKNPVGTKTSIQVCFFFSITSVNAKRFGSRLCVH